MSHTPAPWKSDRNGEIISGGFEDENGAIIVGKINHPIDARRIVACVNACKNISTEHIEGWVISSWAKTVTDHQETLIELKTLRAVNELLKFENERMQSELAKNELDISKAHSEWILGKWNEDAKLFDARGKTDAEKARIILGKWKEALIERPTDQDGPSEPDHCDLAHDHNAMT